MALEASFDNLIGVEIVDSRFKYIFLVAVLFMTSLPIMGILRGTSPPPSEPGEDTIVLPDIPNGEDLQESLHVKPVSEEMVLIPAGDFIRGTEGGGYNEKPEIVDYVDSFWIDKYEVTNYHYQEFVETTGHRKPGPPSRYAQKLIHLRGPNQPVAYVSWHDAMAYCQWRGKRLPTEAEWEKAMRGTEGWTWPWGEGVDGASANFAGNQDGFEYTAPVGTFHRDQSSFGVFDGAGNLMEWADNWYVEDLRQEAKGMARKGGGAQTYKTLRGGGYTSLGIDLRITNRMFMVPDFRDETIGFRCAKSDETGAREERVETAGEPFSQRNSK